MKDFDVFISYSRDDDTNFKNSSCSLSPIGHILKRFNEAGIKPWIDREGKYYGENYLKEISKGINNSEMMLFVSSKNSNKSYYTSLEVCKAAEKKLKIFLLLLDDTPLNEDFDLLFGAKDKRWFYPNTKEALDDLVKNIKNNLNDIARAEKEQIEAEEAERRKKEEEEEKKRKEEEEKKRIEKLEKEIASIKKRIIEYVEKQQVCMKDLLSKEKDLNKSNNENNNCPVCQTLITDVEADYCDICGWHFATPKEFVSSDMQKLYEKRLYASQTIWTQKQQRKEEIDSLKKEKKLLTIKIDEIGRELFEYRNKYNECLEELRETKIQLTKAYQKIKELSKNQSSQVKKPIAFLLVTEFDQPNVYCLYEGKNIFGAMQSDANQTDYQMLVVSDNNLHTKHFILDIHRESKRFVYSVLPNDESCILALNSPSNIIKNEIDIQINDLLFIGDVQIRVIDNFNKTI